MGRLEDAERLENISPIGYDKDNNILVKGEDYHFLLEQAERAEEMESTITVLDNDYQKDIMRKERIAYGYKKQRDSLKEENARLREALKEISEMYSDGKSPVLDHWGMLTIAKSALEETK